MQSTRRPLALGLALAIPLTIPLVFSAAASAAEADVQPWHAPDCRRITGAPSITATGDRGATLAPTKGRMAPVSYTFGLVALDAADTLWATVGSRVIQSRDAGCSWTPLFDLGAATNGALLTLSAAGPKSAYAWAVNDVHVSAIRTAGARTHVVPGGSVLGLGVDPADARRLRYGDSDGAIWQSVDASASWTRLGGLEGVGVYRVAFDPANLDHVVLGSVVEGAWASNDGGRSWQKASGLSASGGPVNVFNLVVSPVNPKVVWAMGLDIAEADAGAPSGGRHIYASSDGGLSYRKVVDQDERITLINGPLLVPAPNDAGVLYFVFGSSFANYGTDLYRYDATTKQVTLTHNAYDNIGAIAFHPRNARLMYLGLVSQDVAD